MNKRCGKTLVYVAAAHLAVAAFAVPAQAEEEPAYESLSEVTIGRLFYSPQQRALLDRRRQGRASSSRRLPAAMPENRPGRNDAAGYIVSSSGERKIYANGEFVAGQGNKAVKFPGDIKIVRGHGTASRCSAGSQAHG